MTESPQHLTVGKTVSRMGCSLKITQPRAKNIKPEVVEIIRKTFLQKYKKHLLIFKIPRIPQKKLFKHPKELYFKLDEHKTASNISKANI